MIRAIAILMLGSLLSGCGMLGLKKKEPELPPAADPNQSLVLSAQGNPGMQQTARTSLLEDNEHLRDLLTKALADRRTVERTLSDTAAERARLASEVAAGQDSIASLSEQISTLQEQLRQVMGERDRLVEERQTLAEMYAVEKRQRLAFEKELLEREIAERTHGQGGP
ncbi:MAG: hypothetical protein V2A76_07015 [Planctomycetota bacterium]